MTDFDREKLEEYKSVVIDWAEKISTEAVVGEIDLALLGFILKESGANLEISESAHESLGRYSNFHKEPGVIEVWGKDRVDEFKTFIKTEFIPQTEEVIGFDFPDLYDPKTKVYDILGISKHSGSMQLLGSLTAMVSGDLSFNDFKRQIENRAKKGFLWAQGSYEPSKNHPFPPDFPQAAIKKIFSWK